MIETVANQNVKQQHLRSKICELENELEASRTFRKALENQIKSKIYGSHMRVRSNVFKDIKAFKQELAGQMSKSYRSNHLEGEEIER